MHRSLLTSTALALLMITTPTAYSQEAFPEVLAAYQQYAAARIALSAAQSSDAGTEVETQAAIAAQQNLANACANSGAGSVDECLDISITPEQRLPGDLDPIPPAIPAPQVETSVEPEVEVEAAPEVDVEPEAPVETEPEVEVETPTPVEEEAEVAPSVEEPVEEPVVEEEAPAPVEEQPAPEPETPVEETPAETEAEVETPSEETADEVESEVETPAQQPAAEEAVVEPAPAGTPAPTEEQPVPETNDQPAEPVEPVEPVEPLEDENIATEEVAPLLDSAKEETTVDAESASTDGEAPAETETQPVAETPAAPAPETDAEAQADAAPVEITSVTEEQGETIAPEAAAAVVVEAPQEAKVVESEDSGFRVVFEFNNQLIVQNQDRPRLRRDGSERQVERLRNGRVRETIDRPNGARIITIYNRNGDILRRSRFTPDGEEYILVYVDEDREEDLLLWRDPGLDLPPLRLTIPAREYILDAEEAEEEDVINFLDQPPVERVQRLYSIDEVKRSARVRDSVRRLEIGNLTFDTGKASISPNQVAALTNVASAMIDLLEQNPAETFLIEGHTDAVGSDISNLSLSDRRAETIAIVLSDIFGVPPENLATQGYGERYLKVRTEAAERINRRVTIRRITPLVSPLAQR